MQSYFCFITVMRKVFLFFPPYTTMQAIILAGGYGTRLAPLTYTRAKPMLPLLNKPMISYLIKALPPETEVIVAVNYKKEQIEEYLENEGVNAVVNEEPKPLGTGGAVKYAEKYIDGTFLVLNSDIISSLNIKEFIKFHKEKRAVATISLWPVENVEEFGVVAIQPDGKITKFVEKPPRQQAPSNLINAGAYCLEPEVLDYMEENKFISMEMEVFPKIIEDGKPFYGFAFDGFWIDVGRHHSYIEANRILLRKRGLTYLAGENCMIDGVLTDSVIGNGCVIGKNSLLNTSILYDNCNVGRNVHMEKCIIGENCVVGNDVVMKNVIVGDNEQIKDGLKLENEKIWSKGLPDGYPERQIGNPVR